MGFFSSRRAEPSPLSVERHPGGEHKSPVRLIRSKLYGKSKLLASRQYSPPSPSQPPSITSITERPEPSEYYINGSEQHSTFTLLSTSSRADVRRSSSDAVTMTLAQRLNELAVANSEGLVDDNEYRLLRQSLFERFASASAVPSETPVVKTVAAKQSLHMSSPSTSNHKTSVMRTPSLRTQTSISSTMSNLFRRATRRAAERRSPKDQDAVSIISRSSKASMIPLHPPPASAIPQQLSRQPSVNSINTVHSRHIPHDLRSISSKRSGRSQAALSDANSASRGFSRSLRATEPPPSSFHPKVSSTSWHVDDDHLRTAADIRAEIRTVEAEECRLLDAFNGLEITAMSRHRPLGSDNILLSEQLGMGDVRDRLATANSNLGLIANQQTPSLNIHMRYSRPSIATRSSECLQSDADTQTPSQSALRKQDTRHAINVELEDIRRRRADIINKYQERIAFLKARLKGAEMHERLLRK